MTGATGMRPRYRRIGIFRALYPLLPFNRYVPAQEETRESTKREENGIDGIRCMNINVERSVADRDF
jgi:hypothetical protein